MERWGGQLQIRAQLNDSGIRASSMKASSGMSTVTSQGGSLASLSSKLPPPTILSTVPQQMFSDVGEGSGEDPLNGDDELVIDIPE
ncbi:hypothetical protein UY3_08354 [Chelonia mydas]|uniref:Uncharacterized protein n=1 Tax=Chelonia mydas TaxID=8469 RepID=M7BBH4_CHEMY|nr:hypothetical protein UY3_08354 [Chelonia mydas]